MKRLPESFFKRPADLVARELLGATIRSTIGGQPTEGMIVETEAYLGFDDPASHGYRARLHAGNASLYAPPGTWYVYRSYGIHWCANLVCEGPVTGSAVLLRAILPFHGIATMRQRRGDIAERLLTNGPGKLCQALGITAALDGVGMRRSAVVVFDRTASGGEVRITPRIGISKAIDWPLRFLWHPVEESCANA